jgi:catechol 2,3-dioxygenase-like lactoylglutathione lyase family enzyme
LSTGIDQRVSCITLGVADLPKAVAFYGALGWRPDNDFEAQDVAFFQAGRIVFALWHRDELAKDSGVEDSGGWGGVTPAYNTSDRAEVDKVMAEAEAAGARIGRPAAETFWGGYGGVFVDPDGHPWEIVHNPGWTVHDDGSTTLS